jgi:hypothetical protein
MPEALRIGVVDFCLIIEFETPNWILKQFAQD